MRTPLSRVGLAFILSHALLGSVVCEGGDAAPNPRQLKAEYKNGFLLTTEDGKFSLRLTAGLQSRYTYLKLDDSIKGNDVDYSGFFIRRARLWWDGYAFDPRFTYSFHLQLEPGSSVNLHDAWLRYKFSDLFALAMGRNKIPYGTEFMASGFSLNFIDRSLMYGETDISTSAGSAGWPGGGPSFSLAAEQPNTGFPIGGLCLFRSQGVSANGMATGTKLGTFQYEAGVWQGRNTKGAGNVGNDHLFAVRLGYYPFGPVNWATQGDPDNSERLVVGFLVSTYADASLHTKDASGASVARYRAHDSGYNLSVLARRRGLSVDLEWGTETYDLNRTLSGPTEFHRSAWRASFAYFVAPGRIELVVRQAEVRRLENPTPDALANSGLGLVTVWDGSAFVDAIEGTLRETTAGINLYLGGQKHEHKVFWDVSLLQRSFVAYNGTTPDAQEDWRFRSMVQLKF